MTELTKDGNSAPADDVVASLREVERFYSTMYERSGVAKVAAKAAAEIERLRTERDEWRRIACDAGDEFNNEKAEIEEAAERQKAQLVEALRPFAEVAGDFDGEADGLSVGLVGDERKPVPEVLVSDFRRARALIKEMEGNG